MTIAVKEKQKRHCWWIGEGSGCCSGWKPEGSAVGGLSERTLGETTGIWCWGASLGRGRNLVQGKLSGINNCDPS